MDAKEDMNTNDVGRIEHSSILRLSYHLNQELELVGKGSNTKQMKSQKSLRLKATSNQPGFWIISIS